MMRIIVALLFAAATASEPTSIVETKSGKQSKDDRLIKNIKAKSTKAKNENSSPCSDAVEFVEEIITAYKSTTLEGAMRYLMAFHEDAEVHMLAGFLEDGHKIQGRDHLGRSLASMAPRETEVDADGTTRKLGVPTDWRFNVFEDTYYAGVKSSADTNICSVYLSLYLDFTVFDMASGSDIEVKSNGIVRYNINMSTDPNEINSKLSLNDYCAPDEEKDVNPDPDNGDDSGGQRKLTGLFAGDTLADCDAAKMAVVSFVSSNADNGYTGADFTSTQVDSGTCLVYYSGTDVNNKKYLGRYTVNLGTSSIDEKLSIDNGVGDCFKSIDTAVVP